MTREELRAEVAALTGEVVGMVSELSPFDWKRKHEIDAEILALFDRYEAEQWKPCSELPNPDRNVLLAMQRNEGWLLCEAYCEDAWHSVERRKLQVTENDVWRELPAPPKGKEG